MQVAFKQTDIPLEQESYAGELNDLRQRSARSTHLVNVLPAGVIVLNEFGYVEEANKIASNLLGEPLVNAKWIEIIARAFNPQADDGHEVSLHDGKRVKIETIDLTPERGQLILLTDLTETRLLQARLNHVSQLSVLGKMMATLAHQIRTPLSSAMLYAANLANTQLNKVSHASFQQKLIARLKDLESQINDMLLFAKSGQQQVAESLSLQQLLTEVQVGSEAMMLQNNAQLIIQLPEPDILIFGNQNALASAIQNLVHNSIQMKPDAALIHISAIRNPDNANLVWLQVQDNGPGISDDKQQDVFEPFFTTRSKGTGLGLAVVKAVVEQHQGRVFVSPTNAAKIHLNDKSNDKLNTQINAQTTGCCFTLELPIMKSSNTKTTPTKATHNMQTDQNLEVLNG